MTARRTHRYPSQRSKSRRRPPQNSNPRRQAAIARQNRAKPLAKNALQFRLVLIWLVFFGSIFSLIGRVLFLQVFDYERLNAMVENQQEVALAPYIPRRTIIDRAGNALAIDQIVFSLYVHPSNFNLPSKLLDETPDFASKDVYRYVAHHLAAVLPDEDPYELEQKFRSQESGILLTHQLDENLARIVRNLRLDGVELVNRFGRFYPYKDVAAKSLGFVNFDHEGQSGVEFFHKHLIAREPFELSLTRAGNGALLPTNLEAGELKYDDWQLKLTLDLAMQRVATDSLKKQLTAFNAKRGAVIVMDVHSGELLTLASEPGYDPNVYYSYSTEEQGELFKNWVVSDLYEPGSTFKPINVAIALDADVITPETVIYDVGHLVIDTWPVSNHDFNQRGGYGSVTPAKILRVSSNIGMVEMMKKLKVEDYYNKLLQLELNQVTGIDLPGEASGALKDRATFTAGSIEAATSSFGQGFTLTPIKLAQLHATLANGGLLVQPRIVKGLINSKGEYQTMPLPEDTSIPKKLPTRIFSEASAQKVVEMMETVVTDGSGKASKIPGYRIAGKTGTAQKAKDGRYLVGKKITSFVSIFPVEDPKYVVMAVVDEPKAPNSSGGTVAAPIVKEVLEALIAKEAIAPSTPTDSE